jgi:hypothetical protein
MDFTNLDKWIAVGKELGIGSMFALVLLAMFAGGSVCVFRASFGRRGFVREFFVDTKEAAMNFLARLTQTLDRLEAAAGESRQCHREQAATCAAMLRAHTDPSGPCNLSGIRAAASHGLDAIGEIGQCVGVDVAKHVEAAKNRLIT